MSGQAGGGFTTSTPSDDSISGLPPERFMSLSKSKCKLKEAGSMQSVYILNQQAERLKSRERRTKVDRLNGW